MKKILLALIFTVLFIVIFFAFAPEDRINIVKTEYRRFMKDPGQLCFDYKSSNLKDPDTARIINTSVDSKNITVNYKAKNGFGAYDKDHFICDEVSIRLISMGLPGLDG